MYEYFDIHSHIYFPDFDTDREEEIKKIQKANIGTITIGTGYETSAESIRLAEEHANFFACIGQHPGDLKSDSVFDDRLSLLSENKKVVAIGECGLDYFREASHDDVLKSVQKTIFEYHIDLALNQELPLMLHIRSSKGTYDAYTDALEVLEHHARISGDKLKGNAHFFAGNIDILRRFLSIGFTVSFTGVITFTSDYDEFVTFTPLDMMMSETDAPFVAPQPHRGKRSSPLYVPFVVERIATLREEPISVVQEAMVANTLRVFPRVAS